MKEESTCIIDAVYLDSGAAGLEYRDQTCFFMH